jgi:LAS superfamily LD-carboxypeptidase LdcB
LKKTITILSILLILAVLSLIFNYFTGFVEKIKIKHTIKGNEQILSSVNYNKRIEKAIGEREKIKIVIREKIVLVENKKLAEDLQKEIDKLIAKGDEIFKIKDDRIDELEKQLMKSNDMLKSDKRFGVELFALAGISERIQPELLVGGEVKFNFLNNRVSLGVGGYGKVYKEYGGGGTISLTVNFGKGK